MPERINPDQVIVQRIETEHWETALKELEHFRQIVPKEMIERLEHPVTLAAEAERRGGGTADVRRGCLRGVAARAS